MHLGVKKKQLKNYVTKNEMFKEGLIFTVRKIKTQDLFTSQK